MTLALRTSNQDGQHAECVPTLLINSTQNEPKAWLEDGH